MLHLLKMKMISYRFVGLLSKMLTTVSEIARHSAGLCFVQGEAFSRVCLASVFGWICTPLWGVEGVLVIWGPGLAWC